MHLTSIGIAELANLEVDDKQAFQTAVEEEQIYAKPAVVNTQPPLPSHKSKVVTEFKKKIGQVLDQPFLQVGFRVFVFQVEKFEHKGIFNGLLGG